MLTEPLRKSDCGREDNFNSDSDDKHACTYTSDTNYVALTGEGEGRWRGDINGRGEQSQNPSQNGVPPPREQSLDTNNIHYKCTFFYAILIALREPPSRLREAAER